MVVPYVADSRSFSMLQVGQKHSFADELRRLDWKRLVRACQVLLARKFELQSLVKVQ